MRSAAVFTALAVAMASALAFGAVGGGDLTLKAKGAGDVVFSHQTHVEDVGIQCTQCHAGLFTNSAGHKKTTMKQMREGKSCGACHNGKEAFSVKGDCAKCHKR